MLEREEISLSGGVLIPRQVLNHSGLNPTDKLVASLLWNLTRDTSITTATNEELAGFCNVSGRTVQRSIRKLDELDVLDREPEWIRKDGQDSVGRKITWKGVEWFAGHSS